MTRDKKCRSRNAP